MKHLVLLIDSSVDCINQFVSIKVILFIKIKPVSSIKNFWKKVNKLSLHIRIKGTSGKCSKKYCTLQKDFVLHVKLLSIMVLKSKFWAFSRKVNMSNKKIYHHKVIKYLEEIFQIVLNQIFISKNVVIKSNECFKS